MMSNNMVVKCSPLPFVALALVFCGCDAGSAGVGGGDAGGGGGAGGAGGAAVATYAATYEVPVPAELSAAATFAVPSVEWSVTDGVAKLEYDLPLGLVGKPVRVEFLGPLDATATTASLTGAAGTADCAVSATSIVCNETMAGLLPLSPDLAVVEQVAASEYAGPAADRIDVAKRFAGDPIGILRVDPTTGATDDTTETEQHGGRTR